MVFPKVFKKAEPGFTLPELMVVSGMVMVMAVLAAALAHPVDHSVVRRNAERWAGVAQITQALSRYAAANGSLPQGVAAEPAPVGSDSDMLDLCPALVPRYAKDVAVDPLAAIGRTGPGCQKGDAPLITGYAVRKIDARTFEVMAPLAENGAQIALRRSF